MLIRFGFVCLVLCVYGTFAIKPNIPKSVIVDLDAGIDDYQALTFLFNAHKRKEIIISAIVLSDGNTALKDVKVNVLRLLEILRAKNIPVYAGSAATIMHLKKLDNHFGTDGFGDLNLKKKPNMKIISDVIAPTAIAQMVKKQPNKYSYIALGPMTNIALAMTMYDHVADDLVEILAMGGDYLGDGPEFNFLADPESVKIVFDVFKKQITLFTWQACVNKDMNIGWRMSMVDKITSRKANPVWELNDKAEQNLFAKWDHSREYNSCDPILIFLILNPEFIQGETHHKAEVEVCGNNRAKVILDETAPETEKNINIIHGYNVDAYKNYYIKEFDAVCSFYKCDDSWLN